MSTDLTTVDLFWREGLIERWIRFGDVAREEIVDRRRRRIAFAPGAVFAFVRWASNEHGTVASRLDILRAAAPGEPITTLPCVRPGGESLLRVQGWARTQEVLQIINAIEALGIDPCTVAPDHWRHVHNRLAAQQAPRPYTWARHRVWRTRRKLEP
jgi:hypothetical protein